jgi:hypothetical protein
MIKRILLTFFGLNIYLDQYISIILEVLNRFNAK